MFPGVENQPVAGACHIVAMPYPGRGHVNPMMNLCNSLVSKQPTILITFVVTEEWLDLMGETTNCNKKKNNNNIRFATLPNVIPSELVRAKDFSGFVQAVYTKLRAPFEKILDGLKTRSPVTAIIADTYLPWVCEVGSSRRIPVASLWTMSATVFSVLLHFDLLRQHGHFPIHDFSGIEEETVDYIPGLPPTPIIDLEPFISGVDMKVMDIAIEAASTVSKLEHLLFTSPYELEPQLMDALKTHLPCPVYPIGPSIPHLKLKLLPAVGAEYLNWLDGQPKGSVLYVSMGSFLSASQSQTEEIVAGVVSSGVPFLVVSRGDGVIAAAAAAGGRGMVVPWCDQLRVLCHGSIGGFWTHCGMNSTLEGVYAGVAMLCWPLFWDQIPNCKAIVEEWRVGWRVRRKRSGELVRREGVAEVVKSFMDADKDEVVAMRRRALLLRQVCRSALAVGGSSDLNLDSFLHHIANPFHSS